MPTPSILRRVAGSALVLAISLGVVWAHPVRAWEPPSVIAGSGLAHAVPQSTGVTGWYMTHFAFTDRVGETGVAMYRRSKNGGVDWQAAIPLSNAGASDAMAFGLDAGGTYVDVTFGEWDGNGNSVLWYQRSTTNGSTWDPPLRLTRLNGRAGQADVTRAGNRVTVVWTDRSTGDVFVRVSNDGGVTFASRLKVGATMNFPLWGATDFEAFPVVSESAGVIQVAYNRTDRVIRARRSSNGTSWTTPITLATNANGLEITMATLKQKVVVGYTSKVDGYSRATFRRSLNSGSSWYAAQLLGGPRTFRPIFDMRMWMDATYARCTVSDCSQGEALFTRSLDWGASWSTVQVVSRDMVEAWKYPVGMGGLTGGRTTVMLAGSDQASWTVPHPITGTADSVLYSRRQ